MRIFNFTSILPNIVIMKKTDTIALYLEEYLNGKSDEDRQRFYEKPVEKQYSTIMAWKRRREIANSTHFHLKTQTDSAAHSMKYIMI